MMALNADQVQRFQRAQSRMKAMRDSVAKNERLSAAMDRLVGVLTKISGQLARIAVDLKAEAMGTSQMGHDSSALDQIHGAITRSMATASGAGAPPPKVLVAGA